MGDVSGKGRIVTTPDHPLQPIVTDDHGVIRFKKNHLIDWMVEILNLNEIARHQHTQEDYDQLLQLVGYSVSGAPLSAECRSRVDLAEDGKHESYHAGFVAGCQHMATSAHCHIDETMAEATGES